MSSADQFTAVSGSGRWDGSKHQRKGSVVESRGKRLQPLGWVLVIVLSLNLVWMIANQKPAVPCEQLPLSSEPQSEIIGPEGKVYPDFSADYMKDIINNDQVVEPDEAKMDEIQEYLTTLNRVGLKNTITLGSMKDRIPQNADLDSVYWRFSLQVSNHALFLPESTGNFKLIDELLHSLATSPVESLDSMSDKGTELKLFARFKDGTAAVLKPQRMERDEVVGENAFYNAERERHFAEIASSHLDRLLGFARVPPCVGRLFNVSSEIVPYVDDTLLRTVHTSPGGNLCYFGKCKYLCDLFHPVCGKPDLVEHSVCVYLPVEQWATLKRYSPWRRAYSCHKVAEWQTPEKNDTYCRDAVLTEPKFTETRTLLDIIDCLVFDFLTGNEDRHSYHKFIDFYDVSAVVNYDNGRAFGRPYRDVMDILAPIYQCCMIRKSTYEKLKLVKENKHGVKLSDLMRRSLARDPLSSTAPILTDRHLEALDRRLVKIFDVINRECIRGRRMSLSEVLVDDGF